MNLLESTSQLINQPMLLPKFSNLLPSEDLEYASLPNGGKKEISKSKKAPKPKKDSKTKPKKESKTKPKVKLIDTFLKTDLEKIAKKHDVSLKARDGKIKTKEQLFNSLKRKKLI